MKTEQWNALLEIDRVVERPSRYKDGLAWCTVAGREIAHAEGSDRLDLRLTRAGIRELHDVSVAEPRPSPSDWVTLDLATPRDEKGLVELVRRAVALNQTQSARGRQIKRSRRERS